MVSFDTPSYYISDANSTSNSVQHAIMQSEQLEATASIRGLDKLNNNIGNIEGGFQTSLQSEVENYLDNTKNLGFQNEIYNTNMYMNQSMTMQEEQISDMSEKARNHIMRMRQKYQLKMYDISYYGFITAILMFAIFVVAMCGVLLGLAYKHYPSILDSSIAWIIVGVVITAYILIVFIYVQNASSRRKTDWSKYNFGSSGVQKYATCNA